MNETQRQMVLLLGIMVMLTVVFTTLEVFNSPNPEINTTEPVNETNVTGNETGPDKDSPSGNTKSVIQRSIDGLQLLWESFMKGLSVLI